MWLFCFLAMPATGPAKLAKLGPAPYFRALSAFETSRDVMSTI